MKTVMKSLIIAISIILYSPLGLFSQKSIVIDQQLGAEGAQMVAVTMGMVNVPVTNEYVNQVGDRLLATVGQPFDFKFQIIDSHIPNAFALPGGYVYVTRGILAILNSEDELAGVMGHEIMHVLERHSVKQMKKSIVPILLQVPGKIVTLVNKDYGHLINAPITSGSQAFLAKYSRGQENEADMNGVEIMSKAGYNPLALAIALENLAKEVEMITGEEEQKSYMSDHPYTPKRVSNIQKKAENLQWSQKPGIVEGKLGFYKKLEGLYFGQNPEAGIFEDNQFLHLDMDFTITFPEEWVQENTPLVITAKEPNGRGMISVGLEPEFGDPSEYAEKLIKTVQNKHKTSPDRSEPVEINGLKGHVVTYTEKTESGNAATHSLWLNIHKQTFQLVGIGFEEQRTALREIALSIRKLSDIEKGSYFGYKIKAVTAKEGESIEELSKRTQNYWDVAFTAIANNIPNNKKFSEGAAVKIVVKELYTCRK